MALPRMQPSDIKIYRTDVIPQCTVPGDEQIAASLLETCYAKRLEPAIPEELVLDHGTIVPLHFLTPAMNVPIVPILLNAQASERAR